MNKNAGKEFNRSQITGGHVVGGMSNTDTASRWENKLGTAGYMSEGPGTKKLSAIRNGSGIDFDTRQPNSSTIRMKPGLSSPTGFGGKN